MRNTYGYDQNVKCFWSRVKNNLQNPGMLFKCLKSKHIQGLRVYTVTDRLMILYGRAYSLLSYCTNYKPQTIRKNVSYLTILFLVMNIHSHLFWPFSSISIYIYAVLMVGEYSVFRIPQKLK